MKNRFFLKFISAVLVGTFSFSNLLYAADPKDLFDQAKSAFNIEGQDGTVNQSVIDQKNALQDLESLNFSVTTQNGDVLQYADDKLSQIQRPDGTVLKNITLDAQGAIQNADLKLSDGSLQIFQNGQVIGYETPDGTQAASFILDPATEKLTYVPQTGNAWRPSVDPFGRQAVYWAGHLRATIDAPGFAPQSGRLVLGSWGTGNSAPTDGPFPTAPVDQEKDRHEVTIAAGQMNDWDARWEPNAGTKLAVWIADANDPSFGRLSLYSVDPFDGRVDLKNPLINARRAKAGYAIAEGRLVWAEPAPADGSGDGGVLMFAWTDKGSGEIETAPGDVIVIR